MNIVQSYGRKKTALAVAHCKRGRGILTINGGPVDSIKPDILRSKIDEVINVLGPLRAAGMDMRVAVHGGGQVARIYAIRQAIAKAFVAFYGKFVSEESKNEIKHSIKSMDRSLLVSDPRRSEPKKFGGKGARARFQKSYR